MSHKSIHKIAVPCDCGCGVVLVTRFDPWGDEPEEVFVEFFEAYQVSGLRNRLRAAWRVVRGKEPWLHSICLQAEGIAEMRRAFSA